MAEKRGLQICVALSAAVAVWAGAWGVINDLGGDTPGLVNHERYLSGLLLAIGLAFWTTLANIEHLTGRFRLLTALVVVGGLSRLVGVAMGDSLSWSITGALVMELVIAPLLCLWQSRFGPVSILADLWRHFLQQSNRSRASQATAATPATARRCAATGSHRRHLGAP